MSANACLNRLVLLCLTVVPLRAALAATSSQPAAVGGSGHDAVDTVTFAEAVELALSRNPRLKACDAAIAAAAARERQADALPNPEIEAEVEDIGLRGDERGLDASVYTVRAVQTIELGHKRASRRRAASLEVDLARWDLEAEGLILVDEVRARFLDLLTAQERVRIVSASHELARKIRDTAAERVRSGKVSPLELTKAEVDLTVRRVDLGRAERGRAAARAALAALWNAPLKGVLTLHAQGDLRQLPQLPDLAALEAALTRNPDLARWETEGELTQATVAQEQAASIPDLTLSAGFAHEQGSGSASVVFAVSLPLPLFDRNRGNIAAAMAEGDKTRQAQRAVAIALRAELAGQWQELQAATADAAAMEAEVLPGARKAFGATQQAYQSGKLEYLAVLDAQQTLFAAEMQWLEALSAVHRATARIERLIGGSMEHEELKNR